MTDLLIGDLFTDKVDVVWEPMESLYAADKTAPRVVGRRHATRNRGQQGQRAVLASRPAALMRR